MDIFAEDVDIFAQDVDTFAEDVDDEQSIIQEECALIGFLPFTDVGNNHFFWPSLSSDGEPVVWQMSHMAAAFMAVDHLNARRNIVVSNLSKLMENCTATTPNSTLHLSFADPIFVNSNNDKDSVSRFLLDRNGDGERIDGIIGPFSNLPTETASTIASGLDIPIVTHAADDNQLTSPDKHPHVARTTTNLHPLGEAIAHWLAKTNRTNYVAVLSSTSEYSEGYELAMNNGLKERNFTHVSHYTIAPPFVGMEANRGAGAALQAIREEGFRTILLGLEIASVEWGALTAVADAAEEYGLNTDDYVWILSGNLELPHLILDPELKENDNVTKLLQGAASLRPVDGFDYQTAFGRSDAFLDEWKRQGDSMIKRLNEAYPIRDDPKEMGYYQAPFSYFATERPQQGAGFMYDAVIAQGLGRCKYLYDQQQKEVETKLPPEEENESFDESTESQVNDESQTSSATDKNGRRRLKGVRKDPSQRSLQQQKKKKKKKKFKIPISPKLQAIYEMPFDGATGRVEFGERKFFGSRKRATVTYGVYNVRDISSTDQPQNPITSQWYYLTDVLQGGPVDGTWFPTPFAPFRYASGSATGPLLLRDEPNQNYLDPKVQIVGWTFFAVLIAYVLSSLAFVTAFQKKPAIQFNQPVFLNLMLIGCLMLSTGMLQGSLHEGNGLSEDMLSALCLSTLWLLVLGYILIYAALFCKLWRINKVLQFVRRKVEVKNVLAPLVGVMTAAVVVLIFWSVMDPFVWVREEIDSATGESYGQCASNNSLPYLVSVASLMGISTIAAAIMAFETKDVDKKFSEAKWIFYTIFVQVQLLMLGIPILIILGTDSAEAKYMGQSFLIFFIVATTVSFMIGPKALRVLNESKEAKENESKDVSTKSLQREADFSNTSQKEYIYVSSGGNNSLSSDSGAAPTNYVDCKEPSASIVMQPLIQA